MPPRTRDIPGVNNLAFHCVGGAALILRRLLRMVRPYRRPRDFPASDVARSVDYDFSVVDGWSGLLAEYKQGAFDFSGRTILELGPGPDLGTGLIMLSRGASRYHALDVNPLLNLTGSGFYEALLERLSDDPHRRVEVEDLRAELSAVLSGEGNRLRYKCSRDGEVSGLRGQGVDLVLSQATLEHISDFRRLAGQLAEVVSPGGIMLGVVDLQTHVRFLRSRDPLNIYRYRDWFYRLVRFPGASNRLRGGDYERILRETGWSDIRVVPLETVGREYLGAVAPHLAGRFHDGDEMKILSMALLASRS